MYYFPKRHFFYQYIFSPSISNRLISLNSLSTPLLGSLTRCVPPRL